MNEIDLKETQSEGVVVDTPTELETNNQEELESQSSPKSETQEKEEEWHWLPKIEREVTDVDETTVEVCPSLLWLNRKKKMKCRKIKRRKK